MRPKGNSEMAGRPQRTLIPGFPSNSSLLLMIESLGSTLRHKKCRGIKGPGPLSPGFCIKVKKSLKGACTEREAWRVEISERMGFLNPHFTTSHTLHPWRVCLQADVFMLLCFSAVGAHTSSYTASQTIRTVPWQQRRQERTARDYWQLW